MKEKHPANPAVKASAMASFTAGLFSKYKARMGPTRNIAERSIVMIVRRSVTVCSLKRWITSGPEADGLVGLVCVISEVSTEIVVLAEGWRRKARRERAHISHENGNVIYPGYPRLP